MDLALVFMVIMGFAVLVYVVLDGYDLGVGMLMPAATEEEQSYMVASIGPFWDANETWLVLGIGVLLSAFPKAHGMVLGALYIPVMLMLVSLMLRGVAFELRVKAFGWHRDLWNWLFWAGSFGASFWQGVMLGRYVTGFAHGFGYWIFAFVTGASLCGGYVLLGATWLVYKTEGPLQEKARAWCRWGLAWVALGVGLVSLGTPLVSDTVREKWFDFPATLGVMILPITTAVTWFALWRAVRPGHHWKRDWGPYAMAVLIFTLSFLGLAYSIFPYVVIDHLTIWEAAAHPTGQRALLVGVAIVLPFIVAYTILSYRIFGGKAAKKLYD
jgi:cytochrome bd ubiquinol oxidase subunit II